MLARFIYLCRYLLVLFLFAAITAASCKKSTKQVNTNQNQPPVDTLKAYQLVWSDEFDSLAINTNNWNFEIGGSGWGNHEKEYYQASNASIANGKLVITAKKENAGSNNYTSARMTTSGKQQFTYGKIEASISIPTGQGLWPAFWLLGANIDSAGWPVCGENDIMEHINADNLIYGTLHWDNNGHVSSSQHTTIGSLSNFHVYSVEWDAKFISWYVDDLKYHEVNIYNSINNTIAFHKPFYIILNFAVGGDWPGQTVDDSKFPARMYVDYVRVYQRL